MHHLVCDAQSHGALVREVMSHLAGSAATLPHPMPYRDHVAQTLASTQGREAEEFFRSKLGDIDEPTASFGLLDLHIEGSRLEEFSESLDSSLASRLRVLARRLHVSVSTMFHAAWGLVVARTTGRDSVVYGTVLFGSLQAITENRQRVGMFLNTLPLRLTLRDLSATELVERTQRELWDLLDHEQSSLAIAQRCSGLSGSAQLFNTLLNYRHRSDSESEWTHEEFGIR
jgi:hypothetical protein